MSASRADVIRRVLREEDVEGLITLHGAPANEYDDEARHIAAALFDGVDSSDLRLERVVAIVTEVCNDAFGPFEAAELTIRRRIYHRIAQMILDGLHE